jgi:hypothetical protein
LAAPVKQSEWLEWVATLVGEASWHSYAATLSPDRFHCLLDDLPLHLIPQYFFRSARMRTERYEPLFLNPLCSIGPASRLPGELSDRRDSQGKDLLAGFDLRGTLAWVRDSAIGFLQPFWLGPRLDAIVSGLHAGDPAPQEISQTDLATLSAAGILIPRGHAADRSREWGDVIAKFGPIFRERDYAPIGNLIHPFHVAALRRYYRCLIRQGKIKLGDPQSPRRYVSYNDPVARFFHQQIAFVVAAMAGEAIRPSYVYMGSYLSGADLKKHIDREQCEFSVTLCLDFSPEPAFETPWPIHLDTPRGTTTVYQALGDGLCYRGTRVPHSRGVLAPGRTSTSIFFHYVAAGFTGSLA